MGCDIHVAIEVRDESGQWKPTKLLEKDWATERLFTGDYNFFDRNYDLFAMLADVRNGRGFAGLTTGEGFNPIDDARGLPADLSRELRRLAEDGGDQDYDSALEAYGAGWLGDHSHSWLTLRELADYDWNQTTRHAKYENERGGWVPLDAKQIGWTEPVTYRERAGRFYTEFMPALLKLGEPDRVRIVFGFDS